MRDVLGVAATAVLSVAGTAVLSVAALVFIVPTGLALFAANATALQNAWAFTLKMVVISIGAVLAIAFHNGPYRSVAEWDTDVTAPFTARAITTLSVLGWLVTIGLATELAHV